MTGKVKKETSRQADSASREDWVWLWHQVAPFRKLMLCVLLMIALFSASSVILPWSVHRITNAISQKNMKATFEGAFLVFAFFVLQGGLNYLQNVVAANLNLKLLKSLRDRVFMRVLSLDFSFFSGIKVGDFIYRVTGNVDAVGQLVDQLLQKALPSALTAIILVGYLFVLNFKLTLVIIFLSPILAGSVFALGKVILSSSQEAQKAVSKMSSYLSEFVTGIGVIKNFAKEDFEGKRFTDITERYRDVRYRVEKAQAANFPLMGLVNGLSMLALISMMGYLVSTGQLMPQQILPYIAAVAMIINPILTIGQTYTVIKNFQVSLQRVSHFFKSTSFDSVDVAGFQPLPGGFDIRFDSVVFGYHKNQPVLHGMNLTIGEREVVGVVGLSGAGKSTLLNLMMRFYSPCQGSVLMGGVDILQLNVSELRRQFGVVMQETFLFSGTIAENIAYGESEVDQEQMIRVAKLAHAHDFIENLPDGYQTAVNERGLNLSGGQKQRLSIARALYHNPRILIMDEATSNIDADSEKKIQLAIEQLRSAMTVIIVAHRFATIRHADRILVLDRGRIIEEGSHEELMQHAHGQYQQLYSTQMSLDDQRA